MSIQILDNCLQSDVLDRRTRLHLHLKNLHVIFHRHIDGDTVLSLLASLSSCRLRYGHSEYCRSNGRNGRSGRRRRGSGLWLRGALCGCLFILLLLYSLGSPLLASFLISLMKFSLYLGWLEVFQSFKLVYTIILCLSCHNH